MVEHVVASVGRISAGAGYDYLSRDVATSKHDYYVGHGEAPGVWAGRGIATLGLGGEVDAVDMSNLYGRFVDPRTAGTDDEVILGRAVTARTIHAGTAREQVLQPVAAFDVTFSPSKSVSALWAATGDERVRASVVAAHEAAVAAGLDYLEDNAGHARAGARGVRRVDSDGLIVAQFRHRTARSSSSGVRVGDPQLHSHCAILNRLRCADGQWRTLDGAAIYRHTHAAGALYGAVLERELTDRLGVAWVEPEPGARLAMREIVGLPESVRAQWSSRRQQVLATYDRLVAGFRDSEHRSPTRAESAALKDRATIRSRQPKTGGNVNLHDQWRSDLSTPELVAIEATVQSVPRGAITGGRVVAGSAELAVRVIEALETQRSWWTRAHLFAEVARLIDYPVREAIELDVERIVEMCELLEADHDPHYAQLDAVKMTSPRILDAEAYVMNQAATVSKWTIRARCDVKLGDDQIAAVEAFTSQPRQVATVIGPAGAGKTTMLQSVAASYEAVGRQVCVLALSAAAARVVTDETGLVASTIASWRVGGCDLPRGGLVVIDEASMVPTLTLRDICRTARLYGSRVGLVGDYAQMGSPEAGGLLRDLAACDSATALVAVRRFNQPWERDASKRLQARDGDVAAVYAAHGRIVETTSTTMIDTIVDAWYADISDGYDTLVVADNTTTAADVSAACQQRLHTAGLLGDDVGAGADANTIRIGDLIQTRHNDASLVTSDGRRVLNRDTWKVTGITHDGGMLAASCNRNATVHITSDYLTRHVVLAYCTTIAGAQGRTVDVGHILVTPKTSAASLYVGMTRGRIRNTAHTVTDGHDHDEFTLGHRDGTAAMADAIRRSPDGELSATTIAKRWVIQQPERTLGRAEDQTLVFATNVWTQTYKTLHPRIAAQITATPDAVAGRLATMPSTQWSAAIRRAVSLTNWQRPEANNTFLDHLARTSEPTNRTQGVSARSAGHER